MTEIDTQYRTPGNTDKKLLNYHQQGDGGTTDQQVFRTKNYKISHVVGSIYKYSSDCKPGYLRATVNFQGGGSKQLFNIMPNTGNKTVYLEDILTTDEIKKMVSIQFDMNFPRYYGATAESNDIYAYIYGCEIAWQSQ